MIKNLLKNIIKLSPIPLSKNHKYDILTKKIMKTLRSDSNCIDVGCFKGEILDLMLKAAPKGKHFAFEPIPSQYEFLLKKYTSHNNIKLHNFAASNETGIADFNLVKTNLPYSGLKKRDYDKPNEVDTTIQVKTELIDNVIPKDLPIHLIKIDVEGAEMLVLAGAVKLISKNKPLVVFEHGMGASNHYGTTPEMVFDYFSMMSMKISTLDSYIAKRNPMSKEEFKRQYSEQINYYFIAHA